MYQYFKLGYFSVLLPIMLLTFTGFFQNNITHSKSGGSPTAFLSSSTDSSIRDPLNWIAYGGCWEFFGKSIYGQAGGEGRHLLFYQQKVFRNFIFEVRLNKLAEGGAFGLIIRYNERKKEGYTYIQYPDGGYRFAIIKKELDYSLFQEPASKMNKGTNVWNSIKIIGIGSKFELYLNDQFLTSITDNSYSTGRIGLFLGGDPRQKAVFEIITLKKLE